MYFQLASCPPELLHLTNIHCDNCGQDVRRVRAILSQLHVPGSHIVHITIYTYSVQDCLSINILNSTMAP